MSDGPLLAQTWTCASALISDVGALTPAEYDGHVKLGFFAESARGSVDEAILEVVGAHGAQLAFAEVPETSCRFDGPSPVIRSIGCRPSR